MFLLLLSVIGENQLTLIHTNTHTHTHATLTFNSYPFGTLKFIFLHEKYRESARVASVVVAAVVDVEHAQQQNINWQILENKRADCYSINCISE